ncbi:Ig-like domain-containing protein [SAR86 cluster bacterium]|nr:Ig-like domain-containing protein [SAR86 cluster bacterium]
MKIRLDFLRSFYITAFLVFAGFLSLQAQADGIASVNQYVEIKPNATDFRARKQSNNGQRSTSGFDFIITPERTNICQQGQTSSICDTNYSFSGLGYVPNGSATSIVFRNTPANSYMVFINDDHNSGTDRTSMIGQIVFDNEILGYWTHPSRTVDFDFVDKLNATYPTSNNNGFSARQTENHVHYGSSSTSSTTSGDWVSISADKKTLRFGAKNGRPGDYIRVITRAANPTVDFNITSSNGAESVSSATLNVDLSFASTQNVTVNYTVTGTATGGGTDYTLANGTLTISAGSTSGAITISGIVNDALDEPNETVIVTLSSPTNATLGSDNVHTYTINDNDNPPVVDFNTTSSNGAESVSSKAITVDLSAASSQNVTVNYTVTGTATGGGTDYTLANGTATIAANSTSTTITIASIVNDTLDEDNETVILTLSNPSNATLGSDSVHTYTITDNDNPPVVDFNTTSSNGAESVSSKALTVDLSAASGKSVTVNYAVTGTATGSGSDYTLENGTLTLSPGSTSGTITIAGIVDDLIDEANETVIVTLSSPNNATLGSDDVHTYTINDNDNAPVVDFNTTSSNGAESVSSKSITVDLSASSTQDVTVDYTVTGTATGSGTDYTLANGTVTIAAGATSATITIAGIVDDGLDETNETVIVTLSNPSNATLGTDKVHTYTITDNDNPPVVDFNIISSSGAESVASKALMVDLSAISGKNVSVNYAVTGTATGSGTDYTLANGTLTISAGSNAGSIIIASIVNDALNEANETVIVTLSSPSNATLGSDNVHTYTITDNDNPPVVDFNATSSSGAESVSSTDLTVDLSAASGQNVTVDYAVTGTATGSGTDYTLANGTLTISAGATSGTITIAGIVDDSLDEPNETVIVTLSSPNNATLGSDNVHTYTITDNDNAPVVDFNTTSSNGAESVASKALTVDLSAASSQNVTVDYAVTGTATGSGTDYTLANGTLTISAGATSGTITIGSIVDDSLDEPNETVIVTLSNPSNATLGNDEVHTYTINDNDNAPAIAFELSSSSGAESVSTKDVIVNLSAVSAQNVTVNYAVTGTATGSGTDYTLANGTLSISAGSTSGTITIAGIVDDGTVEGNETVILTLSSPNNAVLGSNDVHTFTILEPQGSVDISFANATSSGAESVSSKAITVNLSEASSQNVTVGYAVTGTATGSGTDYTLANGTLTISAGATSGTISIAGIVDDTLDEVNETIIISLSNPTNANPGSILVHTYTITDNDNPPVVDFNATSSNGAESVSSKALTVDLSTASGKDVTVNYAVTGTATGSGTDYTLANGTLTISAGATTGTINISSIIDDPIDEANETVIVTLSSPSNATLGSDSVHTYTITDNDNAPVVDFNATSSSGAESASSATLTVDLSAASGQNVTVNYVVTGTATGSGTDYTLANGTLIINAGATSGTITIGSIADDSIDEANETVIVTLSNPSNATLGSDNVHTYTITDNDNAPVVDFNTTSSNGAESVSSKAITVDLSAASGQDVTVSYAVTGTATGSGTDYTLANGTLTINAGATSGTVTISNIIDDLADEANETVIITLSNPSNATLGGDSVHTYTITDNDNPPVVDFNITSSSGAESVSSASLTVDLSAASSQDVTVSYAVTGTATGSGTDYTLANGTLTISAGATSGTITIAGIIDDSVDEPNETVIVTLSNPNNATLGSDSAHTYTITDNEDTPTITIGISTSSSGAESVSSKVITVDLSGPSSQDITVDFTITGTATGSGTDYTLANGTLTISAGATSGTITISGIVDDNLDEADETVIITLSNPSNATLGSDNAHTYTITDNDNTPVVDFNATSSNGAESVSSKVITVDLSAVSGQDVTVDYAVTGTATGAGNDYTLGSGTLTISAGSSTGTITIASIVDDSIDEADETVVLTLSNPVNATLGSDSVHTYTITDNENTPTIDFNVVSSSGDESVSAKAITVDLSGPSSEIITVDFAVTGTATGTGTDYTLLNGTLSIPAGDTTGTITIANIVDDTTDESDETVIVTLSSPNNASLGSDDVHTYTIVDNDNQPTIHFNSASSTGAEDISSVALPVDLSAASSNDITVNYAVTGTATGSGTDYTLADGTLTISAGATSGTITIAGIIDDLTVEGDETVILTLSSPNNATLGSNSVHTYTIADNDGTPAVEFSSASSADLESVTSRSVDVVIPFSSLQQIGVDYAVTGGTAGSGTDYSLAAGNLTIPDGATSGTIIIPTIDDSTDESDETIIITLSNPTNATLGNTIVHTVVINDNDGKPYLTATSPHDDSTRVPVNSDIILTFNEVVNCGSGTINIASDTSSSSFAISLPNENVTGCGTDVITINPPTDLDQGTEYYVLIDNAAFADVHNNSFDGITNKTEFNFKTSVELTDPTLKQPVIDNAKAMNRIATRWVDQNINVISKRMMTSSRQGFRVNFDNKIIDSIKTIEDKGIDNIFVEEPLDSNFVEEALDKYVGDPIVEFCTVNSSGPTTSTSLKIKVHLSRIVPEDVVLDFNIASASANENFSFGNGILNIEAGLKSAFIIFDGIPQGRSDFSSEDRKLIVTLLESSNAELGKNLVYTHTLTDDFTAWTDPDANYFCISDFDNLDASALVSDPQDDKQNKKPTDSNSDAQIANIDNDREEAESFLNTEQLKATVKEMVSDSVKVTAEGELKEVIGDWSVWIDGEFGEFTIGKTMPNPNVLDERSFHIGLDKKVSDDGDLFGFALGLGKTKPKDRSLNSNVESVNYSLSTYGRFEDKNNALQFIFGIGRLEFDSDRQDGNELLTGEREANQLFGSLAFIRSFNNEDSNWLISPYLRLDGSYTRFDKYSENGGEAALTFDELTLSNAKASVGTDISYLFAESRFNAMPYLTLEYGYDYSKTSNQNMYYTLQGPSINYILDLDDGMKAHNWEVDLGLMLQISPDMSTNIGCRWQGRSIYLSDFSSISNNDISSSEVCSLELLWNF